jgi:xanthine dehydrogenase accessory factor
LPATQLTVFGDSPVARALVGLAPRVGLRVALVAENASAADYADAATVLDRDDADQVLAQLGRGGFAVVATQGRRDLQGLKAALAMAPSHLWFVASARKASVLRESLISAGEEAGGVARIIAPAGESIGAHTPEEIALSVLAAVVAARRGRVQPEQPVAAEDAAEVNTGVAPTESTVAPSTGSCCGSASKLDAAIEVPTAIEAAAPVKKSCCGS